MMTRVSVEGCVSEVQRTGCRGGGSMCGGGVDVGYEEDEKKRKKNWDRDKDSGGLYI